jgi:hypothetical protein
MKAGSGEHMEQAYNAQAAIDTEGSTITGQWRTWRKNPNRLLLTDRQRSSRPWRTG